MTKNYFGIDNLFQIPAEIITLKESDLKSTRIKSNLSSNPQSFRIELCPIQLIYLILQTYMVDYNLTSLLEQINLDFHRMEFYLNSILCDDFQSYFLYISQFRLYNNSIIDNVFYLLLLLSTQASFFYQFDAINTFYSLSNVFPITHTDRPTINIIHNEDLIEVIFKKSFKLINIITDEVTHIIQTFFIITIRLIDSPICFVKYGNKFSSVVSSIIYSIVKKIEK